MNKERVEPPNIEEIDVIKKFHLMEKQNDRITKGHRPRQE